MKVFFFYFSYFLRERGLSLSMINFALNFGEPNSKTKFELKGRVG